VKDSSVQDSLLEPLGLLVVRPPVTCRGGALLREALELMHNAHVGSVVITAPDGSPEGIFTERDLLRLAARGELDAAAPIARFMTRNPVGLADSASAYDAALVMARHGIRHVLVMSRGELKGVVSERSLFALQWRSLRHVIHAVQVAENLPGLKRATLGIGELARSLLAQGLDADHVTQFISVLNDRLAQRVVALEAPRHAISDLSWCWLALGSEGRQEQTLSTDQDNAIIFEAPPSQPEEEARARLLPFGKAVNATLEACGFPLCPGNIMAGNPECCLSLAGWRERFSDWVRNPAPEALLKASIFFDFRAIAGEVALAEGLRAWLRELVKGDERFLKTLALNALESSVPLGFFGTLVTGGSGVDAGTIDLKTQGTRVITDAARIYALGSGVDTTHTAERLRGASEALGMAGSEVEAIVEAFYHLLLLRLRNQLDGGSGRRAPNRVAPRELNEFDRRILKESLRQARRLQQRLALDYRR
jgi:CBS domain-containing protein